MKRYAIAVTLGLAIYSSGVFSEPLSDEETAKQSVIKAGNFGLFTGQIRRIGNKDISIYDENSEVTLPPGNYDVMIGRFPLSNVAWVKCNTVAGHAYKANEDSCVDLGLSDASVRVAEAEKKRYEEERQAKYAEYKVLLLTPQSFQKLKEMNSYFSTSYGIFKEDPDKLRPLLESQLKPHYEEEKKNQLAYEAEQARLQVKVDEANAKYEKRMQQEEAARKQNELKQLAAFRKSLAEGDSTSCGLVIEKKAKLVKIQPKSGSEQWVKMDEVFPPSQSCNSIASSAFSVGQMVCKTVTGVTLSIPTNTYVYGSRHYQENKGKNEVIGNVESTSGENMQVRISGITFVSTEFTPRNYTGTHAREGYVLRQSVDSMSVVGGSELRVGQVSWDKTSNGWAACN